jgi:hypothetical protein
VRPTTAAIRYRHLAVTKVIVTRKVLENKAFLI